MILDNPVSSLPQLYAIPSLQMHCPPGAGGMVPIFQHAGHTLGIIRIPSTLIDWLMNAGQQFWNTHQRTIAFLLLHRPVDGSWWFDVPAQECGPLGVCWTIMPRQGIPSIDDPLLMGSLQWTNTAEVDSLQLATRTHVCKRV